MVPRAGKLRNIPKLSSAKDVQVEDVRKPLSDFGEEMPESRQYLRYGLVV